MKLKVDEVFEITKEDLKALLKALGYTHEDAGKLCGLGSFAANRWRASGKIPKTHVIRLGYELSRRLVGIEDHALSASQKSAKAYVESKLGPLAVLGAMGSANPDPRSAITLSIQPITVSSATDAELVDELEARGWNVSLSRRSK